MSILKDLLTKRRSIRKYQEKPVERDKILSCIEAARMAPSAHNVQPWKYIIVDDPDVKARLCDAAFSGIFFINKFARHAPVIVVITAEPDIVADRLGKIVQGLQYFLLDIGASIEHFLLQAAELGLGACWLGWFSEARVKKILKIPGHKKIASMISLGYPAEEKPKEKFRKSVEEVSSFNSYKR
jgi:nitroreductase